ncbi:MAG: hypothetical protein AAGD11_20610 [Planctomycetota bacterium]
MANERWQKDWSLFIDLIQQCLNAAVDEEQLAIQFAGKSIKWEGRLEEKHLDAEPAPSVTIAMQEKNITVGESSAVLDFLTVFVADDAIQLWREIETGSIVEFTAQLRNKNAILPPIFVLEVGEGQAAVMFGLSGGRLVGIAEENLAK